MFTIKRGRWLFSGGIAFQKEIKRWVPDMTHVDRSARSPPVARVVQTLAHAAPGTRGRASAGLRMHCGPRRKHQGLARASWPCRRSRSRFTYVSPPTARGGHWLKAAYHARTWGCPRGWPPQGSLPAGPTGAVGLAVPFPAPLRPPLLSSLLSAPRPHLLLATFSLPERKNSLSTHSTLAGAPQCTRHSDQP